MILHAILFSIITIIYIVATAKLIAEGDFWSIGTTLGAVIFLFLTVNEISKIGDNRVIHNVKTVQIDTVITTSNHLSDTTYVIKYTK